MITKIKSIKQTVGEKSKKENIQDLDQRDERAWMKSLNEYEFSNSLRSQNSVFLSFLSSQALLSYKLLFYKNCVVAVVKLMQVNPTSATGGKVVFNSRMNENVGSINSESRMYRQCLCIKHTQVKARQPRLSGGCKLMHRI